MDFTKYLNQQIPIFYGGSNGNKVLAYILN